MSDPEIGTFVETCGYRTNVHDQGQGKPVVLLHGSGAGVSGVGKLEKSDSKIVGSLPSVGARSGRIWLHRDPRYL